MDEGDYHLRRALISTLPGATLISIPVGSALQEELARRLGTPTIHLHVNALTLGVALWILVPTSLLGSFVAIHECARGAGRMAARIGIFLINVVSLLLALGIVFTFAGSPD